MALLPVVVAVVVLLVKPLVVLALSAWRAAASTQRTARTRSSSRSIPDDCSGCSDLGMR